MTIAEAKMGCQPREDGGRGTIHPIGIPADNLESLVTHSKTKGLPFRKEIRNFELWKGAMTPAPANVRRAIPDCHRKTTGRGDKKVRKNIGH